MDGSEPAERLGTEVLDGSDRTMGRFANYLFFEHSFPQTFDAHGEGSLGMTAALTALASAIDESGEGANIRDALDGEGPVADLIVLLRLAKESTTDGGSIFGKAWDVTTDVARATWEWVQRWGHPILKALSKVPYKPVGVTAAVANTMWYSLEGTTPKPGCHSKWRCCREPGQGFGQDSHRTIRQGSARSPDLDEGDNSGAGPKVC